jgi:peptidoglycan/xylan/chitin deacetylase (PgdA/CDA1 family)
VSERGWPRGGQQGALVISLDFELHWGVRDVYPAQSRYTGNLLGAREAIPRMLDIFTAYEVGATWATVGFLFAESREELEAHHPRVRPTYVDPRLDPYAEPVGSGEKQDPLHFAPSLIQAIRDTPAQEVATHTYSHYYALEPGSNVEGFRYDLASATALAGARGVEVRSIVMPRNQWNPSLAPVLSKAGIRCYRGNQPGWMYRAGPLGDEGMIRRSARFVDAHLPLVSWSGARWEEIRPGQGLCNVPASGFLRSVGAGTRLDTERRAARIKQAMKQAARSGRLFHLWWHPHNFGRDTPENLGMLRDLLDHFRRLRDEEGMRSLTMCEAAGLASRQVGTPTHGQSDG